MSQGGRYFVLGGIMAAGPSKKGNVAEHHEGLRPLLFSIAYRMVGSASDAEDIVQEAFLRFHRESEKGTKVDSPKAYLSAITTRLAIDHLRSARVRRERYVGTWLPEPVLMDAEPDVAQHAETADSLSMAFLVLLESLSPVERAVFLLHEVFDYGYDEIAAVVGKSEENCRQIAVRARRQVEAKKPRFEASRKRREELAQRFFDAAANGDAKGLVDLLAADVVVYADGGGKGPAFPRPVHGRERAARVLLGGATAGERFGVVGIHTATINGQPGALFFDEEGRVIAAVTVDIADDLVQTVRAISNPDKLRHLGTVIGPSGPNA
ncbi:MAG TPA: RNA polymerase sigma-70 factor [Actinomycetota bacterium]|nr:RNA polymerase sigma-70 factor [Actinomycetota bacterium]